MRENNTEEKEISQETSAGNRESRDAGEKTYSPEERPEMEGILEIAEGGFGFLRFNNFLSSEKDCRQPKFGASAFGPEIRFGESPVCRMKGRETVPCCMC